MCQPCRTVEGGSGQSHMDPLPLLSPPLRSLCPPGCDHVAQGAQSLPDGRRCEPSSVISFL